MLPLSLVTLATCALASGPIAFDISGKNALLSPGQLKSYFDPSSSSKGDKTNQNSILGGLGSTGGDNDDEGEGTVANNLTLTTSYNFYFTNVSIGNPPQPLQLALDTGSPYMWVYGPNGSWHGAPQFYPAKSSTYKRANESFMGSYGAGQLTGTWATDDLTIGDGSIKQFPFGVIDKFQVAAGVPGLMGVGPGPDLANVTYSNVPEALWENGDTDSPIFSVFLDKSSSSGQVIFGGYDSAKFIPPVYKYDILHFSQTQPNYYYQLKVDSASIDDGEEYTVSSPAILDTGSPFCQLPPGLVDKLGKKLGFTFYEKYQAYYQPANQSSEPIPDFTFTLNIGKLSIDINSKDLIVPGQYLWVDDGPKNVKALGVMGAPSYVLGDVFFKNVYAAFDSVNSKIYLARPSNNYLLSNIKPFDNSTFQGAVPGTNPATTTYPTKLTPMATGTKGASGAASSAAASAAPTGNQPAMGNPPPMGNKQM
uniref:ARAD1D47190p n=1 Tax=Blastobotrys adeninivorans TaxID=409370 RepID=A0A060TDW2_BLAAD